MMTQEQLHDLFIEWDLYSPKQQEAIIDEFHQKYSGDYTKAKLLEFLKEKLEIVGYWKQIGLA